MHVVIIGGGIAGLVAAYTLAKAGARITLLETADRLGGLAGAFTIEPGVEIERYYHFICKPDKHYFAMLNELGIGDRLRWATTDMGLFHNDALRPFGDPLSLSGPPRPLACGQAALRHGIGSRQAAIHPRLVRP